MFLDTNQQLTFIKPLNYERSKKRKYKNNIGSIENMEYAEKSNSYIYKNGKQLSFTQIRRSKSKTGYVSEKTFINVRNVKVVLIKKSVSKGTTVKPQ